MKTLSTLALAALLAAGTAATAQAQQTATFFSVAGDGGDYGDSASIGTGGTVGTDDNFNVAGSSTGTPTFGVITFGDAGLPYFADTDGNSEFISAISSTMTLSLFDNPSAATAPGILDFYLTDSSVAASGLTYQSNTANGIGSQLSDLYFLGADPYTASPGSLSGNAEAFNLTLPSGAATTYLLNQLNTGGDFGIVVAADPSTPAVAGTFYGSNLDNLNDGNPFAGNAGLDPQLTVTAVPESSSFVLLGLGALPLAILARRRETDSKTH